MVFGESTALIFFTLVYEIPMKRIRLRVLDLCAIAFELVLFSTEIGGNLVAQEPPQKVTVLPIFVVPKGQKAPKKKDIELLERHLRWAQSRYREMLSNQSTFKMEDKLKTFRSKRTLNGYQKGNAADFLAEELLEEFRTDRFSCKYIFVAVFVNPKTRFPKGGGRPFNGGINTGGGIVVFSSKALNSENFQSTLQHELGHAFGLTHVNMYGYDMTRSDSIMAYNPKHHTHGFTPSRTPGILIPEDLRGLAFNDRVFDNLEFDKERQSPRGYELKDIYHLGPMNLPNHPLIQVKTTSGERYSSSVKNIVHLRIKPSNERSKVKFDAKSMWHSAKQDNGIASVTLKFPKPIELDRIKIYSQHSRKSHEVKKARVSTGVGTKLAAIATTDIDSPDGEITFTKTKSQYWKLDFQAGKSKAVVIRGLRFFSGDKEFYPPLVPYHAER